jgi:hypothetical protein
MSASAAVSRVEPGSAGPARAASVISTGTVQILGLVTLPSHDPAAVQRLLDS